MEQIIFQKDFFTGKDYDLLPEGAPYQLIGGKLIMTPAPVPNHQKISRNLEFIILKWLKQNDFGEIYDSPIDVELNETTIVQPDLLIIKKERLDIIKEKRIVGAPDVVIEILSSENAYYDLRKKFKIYENAGIPEYWIVDPEIKSIEIYKNENGRYKLIKEVEKEGAIESEVLNGLSVDLTEVFF
jgi:Uma2 family endonuclease